MLVLIIMRQDTEETILVLLMRQDGEEACLDADDKNKRSEH